MGYAKSDVRIGGSVYLPIRVLCIVRRTGLRKWAVLSHGVVQSEELRTVVLRCEVLKNKGVLRRYQGKAFGELQRFFPDAVVCGVMRVSAQNLKVRWHARALTQSFLWTWQSAPASSLHGAQPCKTCRKDVT